MTRALLIFLACLSGLAFAGPSTTFDWSEAPPLDGESKSQVVGTTQPFCVSWVPVVGITNLTSLSAYLNHAAATGSFCDLGIYDAAGGTLLTHTGARACDITGVFQATGLTPVSLAAGTKYQRCWCGTGTPNVLGYNENFGGDFGRAVRNTLSVPLRFSGTKTCKVSGALPDDLGGTFTPADAKPAFVLMGTSSP